MLFRLSAILLLSLAALGARADVSLLVSIKPLQLIAAAVQDGVGQPGVLLPPGASAHHYMLKPSDARRLQQADLFYWIGPDLEGFLPRMLATRDKPSLALASLPDMHLRHFGETHHDHDHGHAPGDDDHDDDHHDHEHRPGSLDAHLWLLPENAKLIARRMAADLARLDAANADRYQVNLQAFEQRLGELDQRLRERLAPLQGKPFFVFHETYDYFEQAYGLRHAGVISLGEVQPGARQVARLRERLRAAGPTCLFHEPPQAPRLAHTLIEGLPARLAPLDALGHDQAVDARGYERLLDTLGSQLTGCLTTPGA